LAEVRSYLDSPTPTKAASRLNGDSENLSLEFKRATDRVEFKNPSIPHIYGRIDPNQFTPFPKNTVICKFLLQLGRYEELGSGVRRVNQYLPHYAPSAGKPVFEDAIHAPLLRPFHRRPSFSSHAEPKFVYCGRARTFQLFMPHNGAHHRH
jgi:hypothetical protein